MEELLNKLVDRAKGMPLLDAPSFYEKAYACYQAGHFKEAVELFRLLCSRYPLESSFWSGLGASCQEMNDYPSAMSAWAMNALLDRANPMPHFHAAQCAYSSGNVKDALLALQEAKNICPEENPLFLSITTLEERWRR